MNLVGAWFPLAAVHNVGWALIHFLWQGLLLAVLLRVILATCRSPVTRHNWALGILVLMAISPIANFLLLQNQQGSTNALEVRYWSHALSAPGLNTAIAPTTLMHLLPQPTNGASPS